MNDKPFQREIERALTGALGEAVRVTDSEFAGGGCISEALRLQTTAGPFFLKYHIDPPHGMFEREAEGLNALRRATSLRIPEPLAFSWGGDTFPHYLLMEYIPSGPPPPLFFERFGQGLAELHMDCGAEHYGFPNDNFIGLTPQPNRWGDDWVAFFRDRRLGHQLKLAERKGYLGELQTRGRRLLERLPEFLHDPAELPTLLHGDLWSGNYLCSADGDPVLIDPAAYYGRREADLAMMKLFGGFPPALFEAYEEVWPLADGSEDRIAIYQLYHLLNHLNLFGGGYAGQCLEILRRYS